MADGVWVCIFVEKREDKEFGHGVDGSFANLFNLKFGEGTILESDLLEEMNCRS